MDPETGERHDDVLVIWVESEPDKLALTQDDRSPFTTGHFEKHPPVLVRVCRLGEIGRAELTELIQDAWVSQASARRAQAWLQSLEPDQ